MVKVSKEFIKDLINSIEWHIEKGVLPEGSGLPLLLEEAKELLNNKRGKHG
jgi:hypothetical protein